MTEEQLCHGRGGPRHYRLLRHAFFLKKLATRHTPQKLPPWWRYLPYLLLPLHRQQSFNHRYKTSSLQPPTTMACYAAIHTILIKQRRLLYKHRLSSNKQSPFTHQYILSCHNLHQRQQFQPAHTHRFICTLHYINEVFSLTWTKPNWEQMQKTHNNSQHHYNSIRIQFPVSRKREQSELTCSNFLNKNRILSH